MRETDRVGSLSALDALLQYASHLHVWVVGDVMLDEYVTGAVERISPEAPVPVVRTQATEHRLGGAANVAHQIAALGARVSLGGIVGGDDAGERLRMLCGVAGIDTRGVLTLSGRQTTRKLRIMGQSQQLLRLDWEDINACTPRATGRLISKLVEAGRPDAVILSDYAKGVLTLETIAGVAQGHTSIPIVVDPKHRDFHRYHGATVLTPNLHELEVAIEGVLEVGDTARVAAAARTLLSATGVQSMVVTLGKRGMLVVPSQEPEVLVPAIPCEVYDVTGAGDTAIAVLTLALATRVPLVQAARLANAAAGVSVSQVGTVAVSAASIREALATQPESKLVSHRDLAARAVLWRTAGKRIVLSNGCFDILHAGHLALLNHAATLGDILVLAINSDASVRRLKGPERPLVPQAERAALLAALTFVNAVTIFEEDTPLSVLESVKPNVLVKGGDYQPSEVVGRELVEANGGRVEIVPLMPEKSTTRLVERIRGAALSHNQLA